MRSYRKTLLTALCIGAATAALTYIQLPKTSPACHDLREKLQQLTYNENSLAGVIATMPENVVEEAIGERLGQMTPEQCSAEIPNYTKAIEALGHTPWAPHMREAADTSTQAVLSCRDKRVSGELKTHADSAQCSNPQITAAFQAVHYPYMDLVGQFTAKRLEQGQKIDSSLLPANEDQLEFARLAVTVADEESKRVLAGKQ